MVYLLLSFNTGFCESDLGCPCLLLKLITIISHRMATWKEDLCGTIKRFQGLKGNLYVLLA